MISSINTWIVNNTNGVFDFGTLLMFLIVIGISIWVVIFIIKDRKNNKTPDKGAIAKIEKSYKDIIVAKDTKIKKLEQQLSSYKKDSSIINNKNMQSMTEPIVKPITKEQSKDDDILSEIDELTS